MIDPELTAEQIGEWLDRPVVIPRPEMDGYRFEGSVEWNGWPGWTAKVRLTYSDGSVREGEANQGYPSGAIADAIAGAKGPVV